MVVILAQLSSIAHQIFFNIDTDIDQHLGHDKLDFALFTGSALDPFNLHCIRVSRRDRTSAQQAGLEQSNPRDTTSARVVVQYH